MAHEGYMLFYVVEGEVGVKSQYRIVDLEKVLVNGNGIGKMDQGMEL
jgi:hypothetical protein